MKALLVCNDILIYTIYRVNLKAYVGLEITLCEDQEKLNTQSVEDFDLVIVGISAENIAWTLPLVRRVLDMNTTRQVCFNLDGSSKTEGLIPTECLYIKNKFNTRDINRACAKQLNITAQKMVEIDIGDYFAIPSVLLNWSPEAMWNLYKIDGLETLPIAKKGDDIADVVAALKKDNTDEVFVEAAERLICINDVTAKTILFIKNSTSAEKLKVAESSYETILDQFTKIPQDSEQISKIALACVDAMDDVMKEHSDLQKLLKFMLDNKTGFLFTHSVLISYLSQEIIAGLTWGNIDQAQKLGVVSFFHDIYLVPIYEKYSDLGEEDDLIFNEALSDDDKNLAIKHARLAGEQVSMLPKMPMGVDTIITQHHGQKNGEGIAFGPSDEISPLAKVIQIAEAYALGYIEAARKKEKFSKSEFFIQLKEQFDKRSYLPIIEALEKKVNPTK